MSPLGPGGLGQRLAGLTVFVEDVSVELRSVPVPGYYGGQSRPTGVISLAGTGYAGRGENVDWTPAEQAVFQRRCQALTPRIVGRGPTTVGAIGAFLRASGAHRHHRAAIEAAAIDLGLRQAGMDLFELAGRPARPVRFCWSIGREEVERRGPLACVEELFAQHESARVKIDCPPQGWSPETWEALAATRRVVVVDFKRQGRVEQVELAGRLLPDAWLEDPPLQAGGGDEPQMSRRWFTRVALDGYVMQVADLANPPFPPAAVNVKASRLGGVLEALACLERCARQHWTTYIGGMFEVDVGRRQARILASLFSPDGWNDLAPPRGCPTDGESVPERANGFG